MQGLGQQVLIAAVAVALCVGAGALINYVAAFAPQAGIDRAQVSMIVAVAAGLCVADAAKVIAKQLVAR